MKKKISALPFCCLYIFTSIYPASASERIAAIIHNTKNSAAEMQQEAMAVQYQREEAEYEQQMDWVDELVVAEDYVVMAGWKYSDERGQDGYHSYEKWVFFLHADGQTQELYIPQLESDQSIDTVTVKNGVVYIASRKKIPELDGEMEVFPRIFTAVTVDGTLLYQTSEEDEIANPDTVAPTLLADKDGDLWFMEQPQAMIYCLSGQGAKLAGIDGREYGITGLAEGKDGTIYGWNRENEDRQILYRLDKETGEASDEFVIEIPAVEKMRAGIKGDLLLLADNQFIDYTIDSREPEVFCDLSEVGIDAAYMRDFRGIPDKGVCALITDSTRMKNKVIHLTKELVPEEMAADVITVAALEADNFLRSVVTVFNQSNEKYRIRIKEYYDPFSEDADIGDAWTRLNADLIDGTAGDILDLASLEGLAARKQYVQMGILENLYDWMERDEGFNRADYLEGLWEANEIDGGLYNLVPLYTVNTKVGRTSQVGTGYDLDWMLKQEAPQTVFGELYTQKEFWHDFYVFYLKDREQGADESILADMETMAEILRFVKELPAQEEETANDWNALHFGRQTIDSLEYGEQEGLGRTLSAYLTSKAILGKSSTNKEQIAIYEEIEKVGREHADLSLLEQFTEPVSMVGFPVEEGCGSAFVNLVSLGICTASEKKEGAWEFLKATLSDEAQVGQEVVRVRSFPVKKSVWQEECEFYCEPYQSFLSVGNTENGEEWFVMIPFVTQETVDEFNELVEKITCVDEADPQVLQILCDESENFFKGNCTEETAAKAILSQVKMYQSESEW